MPNVSISLVAEALKQSHVEPSKIREIIELLNLEANAQGDEEAVPPVKKQYVVLVSDPEGKLPKDDFVAWVLQAPEDANVRDTLPLVWDSAWAYNVSKRGRMMPVKTVGEAIENVGAKYFKERGLWVKTKTPVLLLKSDNAIPRDETITYTVNGKPIE